MTEAERAKQIIAENRYMTIATASPEGEPWSTPVFMLVDDRYNFYWTSYIDTRHSQFIGSNNRVAITIFDSSAPPGQGGAVYISGKAYVVEEEKELEKIITLFYDRKGKSRKEASEFLGASSRRFYKAVSEKAWINADGVNKRIEIQF